MDESIIIHYFQTTDGEWLCAEQEPAVHRGSVLAQRMAALSELCGGKVSRNADEHLAVMARIAIHHAMEVHGVPDRRFTLQELPSVARVEVPSDKGALMLNLFEGVTVWRRKR